MLHINSRMKETPLYLLEIFLPEMYECSTIKEFIENKDSVKPTKKILPWGAFYRDHYIVNFPNLIFNTHPTDSERGIVSDLENTLEVRLDSFKGLIGDEKDLRNGTEIYYPSLTYRPKDQQLWLSKYQKKGPPKGEKNSGYENFSKIGLAPDLNKPNLSAKT